jgi:ABC-type nitrate/sulfonate/bicarbonate transport system, permease component
MSTVFFKRRNFFYSTCALVFGLGLWQLTAVLIQATRGVPFPTPWDCFLGLMQLLGGAKFLGHSIYQHITASFQRWSAGFFIALAGGMIYAGVAVCIPWFKTITKPTVEVLQLIPGLAWVPVVILMFGLNAAATVAIITLTTFPIIAVSASMGFGSVPSSYIQVGRMCGYGLWGLFRTVYIPCALPHLLSGLRIALGSSWRVLVAAEMVVGAGNGLGYAIIQSRWTMDYVAAFVCIIIIAVIGLAIERLLLAPLERRVKRYWRTGHAE